LARSLAAVVLVAAVGSATPAYADYGGGCKWTFNAQVCISVQSGTTNPLYFDYYIWPSAYEYHGAALVEWICGASYAWDYLGNWEPVGGHSPVYSLPKRQNCTSARTLVDFYRLNPGYEYMYTAVSPWQYW
jgi:hypothetical protein